MTQQYYSRVRTQRIENRDLNTYSHTHTQCGIIRNGLKVETIQESINRGMDEQNVVYTHNGILFIHKKE